MTKVELIELLSGLPDEAVVKAHGAPFAGIYVGVHGAFVEGATLVYGDSGPRIYLVLRDDEPLTGGRKTATIQRTQAPRAGVRERE